MSTLLACPSCKADTPDDGRYCDQCAGALNRCPTCGTVSAGAFCPRDRTPLNPTSSAVRGVPRPPSGLPPRAVPAPPKVEAPAGATTRGVPADAPPRPLVFKPLNAQITSFEAAPGEMLGRVVGRHAALLASLHDRGVSSRHARVDWSPVSGWSITDIGSSYGVDVRSENVWPTPERSLAKDQSHPLTPGSFVRLGDLLFQVL